MRTRSPNWVVIGESVRGASHFRNGLPNQDSIHHLPMVGGSAPIILALSDGHGSPRCFRSAIGAKVAVATAVEASSHFLTAMRGKSLSVIKDSAERYLSTDIVKIWSSRVSQDQQENPFTDEELFRLENEAGTSAKELTITGPNHLLAYGATLILVVLTADFLFCLQLGDGDLLIVTSEKEVRRPLIADPAHIANETNSLCMPGAQRLFQFSFQAIHDSPPALILAATDGYSNAFVSNSDFEKVGTDMLELYRTEGPDYVRQNLPSWLNAASENASGDDVTVGMIFRDDSTKPWLSFERLRFKRPIKPARVES